MPSRDEAQTTYQKAHRINLDGTRHGTFAEIGAGQEVVRWFFHVGGAAGTVAKSISAYDMAVSDSLYGPSDRYVSRSRLMAMLDHEYRLLLRHLGEKRRADTAFFVFANTMAARSYTWRRPGHGWVGLRFQHEAAAEPSEVIIHVRMLDTDNVREQEAIGVLGVNLIHAAFYRADRVEDFLSSLTDTLSEGRVEIDMARFTGPRFHDVDNRMVSLELVEQELTQTAMFGPEGEPLQPGEVLYKRPVLIERGKFRPVTTVTLDLIERSKARFESELSEEDGEPVVLMEMSLRDLAQADRVDHEEFLASADVLGALGQTVMISRLAHHHAVSTWLRNYTPQPLRFVMGAPAVVALFDASYYDDLEGGLLESMGRLFNGDVRLFVYPHRETEGTALTTLETIEAPADLEHLFLHLKEHGLLEAIEDVDETYLHLKPAEVQERIQAGDPSWESLVPDAAVELIKERRYFGYPG